MNGRLSFLMPFRTDGGERHRIFEWAHARLEVLFPHAEVIVADDGAEQFSRAGSRNAAAREATGDLFVIVDADTVFSRDQIERAVFLIDKGAPWVIPYGRTEYYNLNQHASAELLTQPPGIELQPPTDWDHRVESWAGVLVVPRAAFEQVHGYDERFAGWGGEDNAFRFALDVVAGGHTRLAFENVQHIWHPRGPDFAGNEWAANRKLMRRYQTTTSHDAMVRLCQEHGSYQI